MSTIYREYDCQTGQLNLLRPTVSGGVRGDANALKIVFIYTEEDYLADKRPYIVFDIENTDADPVTDADGRTHFPLYMFSEDTSPSFDGYTFTVPAEILNKVNGNYVYFQLGFVGLTDDLSDYSFTQSNIENLEFTAANKLIVRDSLSSELSQAPSYYAWADYYRKYGLLSPVQKEDTENGCVLRFRTYSGDLNEVEMNYVRLDENGNIPSSIYPNITVKKERYVTPVVTDADKRMFAQTRLTRKYVAGDVRSNGRSVTLHRTNASGVTESYQVPITYVCYITDAGTTGRVQTNYPGTSLPVYYARVTDADNNVLWYYCNEYGTPVEPSVDVHGRTMYIEVPTPRAVITSDPDSQYSASDVLTEYDIGMLNLSISTYGSTYSSVEKHNEVDDTDIIVYRKDTPLTDGTVNTVYLTPVVETDEITGVSKSVWYECNSDGILVTEVYDAETSVPLFEYRTNKIDSWTAYSVTDGMNQYPTARLVKNALDVLGRVDKELLPYDTDAVGDVIQGLRPVQGGAIHKAIRTEQIARERTDSLLADLTTVVDHFQDDLYGEEVRAQDGTVSREGGQLKDIYDNLAELNEVTAEHTSSIDALDTKVDTAVTSVNTSLASTTQSINDSVANKLTEYNSAFSTSLANWNNTLESSLREMQYNISTWENNTRTEVTSLKLTTEGQTSSLTSLQSAVSGLTNSVSNMTSNLNIDFDTYDLVKVKKGSTIDESLIPNLAITDFFGPYSSKTLLTSASKVVTRNIEEKVRKTATPRITKEMTREYQDTTCAFVPVVETMEIRGETVDVVYNVYKVSTAYTYLNPVATEDDDGSISVVGTDSYSDVPDCTLLYRVVKDGANFKVYQGDEFLVYNVNRTYDSVYTSYAVFSATGSGSALCILKFDPNSSTDVKVYAVDGTTLMYSSKDGVASLSNGVMKLRKQDYSGDTFVVRELYRTAEYNFTITLQSRIESFVYDEFGDYVYEQTNAVLRLEVEAARAISPVRDSDTNLSKHNIVFYDDEDTSTVVKTAQSYVYSIDGDSGQMLIVPTTAYTGAYPDATSNYNMNTYTLYDSNQMEYTTGVNTASTPVLYYFYIVERDGADYRVIKADKTKVTGSRSEIVYPQRGDIAVVKGSSVGVDDGTYILGGTDSTGNTYSSVLTHWLKFNCPQAEWGKISTASGAPSISEQADLKAALDAKAPKFSAGDGLNLNTSVTPSVLGHTNRNVSGNGKLIGGANEAVRLVYDACGHITSAKVESIYPPKDLSGTVEASYWGIKTVDGNKVGAWISPDVTVSSDGEKPVSGSAVYSFVQGPSETRDETVANAVNSAGVVPYLTDMVTTRTAGKQAAIKTVEITFPEQTSGEWSNITLTGTANSFPAFVKTGLSDVSASSKVFLVFYGDAHWYNMQYKIGVYRTEDGKVTFMRDGNVPMGVSVKGTLFIVDPSA